MQSKKERVIEMVKDGYNDEEIAEILNTSKNYVQKIKSISKNKEDNITLNKDDRMIIYNAFTKGKKPPEVIAKYGYSKKLIDDEYAYFKKYEKKDINDVKDEILEMFVFGSSARLHSLKDKDKQELKQDFKSLHNKYKKIISRDEFIDILETIMYHYYYLGYNDGRVYFDLDIRYGIAAPKDWTFLKCSRCKKDMTGVIVDPNDELGKYVINSCSLWRHAKCTENRINSLLHR